MRMPLKRPEKRAEERKENFDFLCVFWFFPFPWFETGRGSVGGSFACLLSLLSRPIHARKTIAGSSVFSPSSLLKKKENRGNGFFIFDIHLDDQKTGKRQKAAMPRVPETEMKRIRMSSSAVSSRLDVLGKAENYPSEWGGKSTEK
jgi:hypothetical protein